MKRLFITLVTVAIAFSPAIAAADTLVGKDVYGPWVETWNDKLHHELGTHQARHLTPAGQAWRDELIKAGCTEQQANDLLRAAYANGNKIPAPVDAEPDEDRLPSGQDSASQTLSNSNLRTIKVSVFGVFNKADTKELFRMMRDHDGDAIKDMYLRGKGMALEEGTQVYLVAVDIFAGWNKVRPKGSSQEIWVPKDFLQ